jgi:hypothetical protein
VAWGHKGIVTPREYSDLYYRYDAPLVAVHGRQGLALAPLSYTLSLRENRDFFYYSRSKNPQALIMSRPVDRYNPSRTRTRQLRLTRHA